MSVMWEWILKRNLVNGFFILDRGCHCKKGIYRETSGNRHKSAYTV
jgi:hypothetical protein